MYYRVKDFNVLLNLSEVRIKKIARTDGKMNFHVLSAGEAVVFFSTYTCYYDCSQSFFLSNDRYPG